MSEYTKSFESKEELMTTIKSLLEVSIQCITTLHKEYMFDGSIVSTLFLLLNFIELLEDF